jgi:hypothetical protein
MKPRLGLGGIAKGLPLDDGLCGAGVPPLRFAGILPVTEEQGQDALATV